MLDHPPPDALYLDLPPGPHERGDVAPDEMAVEFNPKTPFGLILWTKYFDCWFANSGSPRQFAVALLRRMAKADHEAENAAKVIMLSAKTLARRAQAGKGDLEKPLDRLIAGCRRLGGIGKILGVSSVVAKILGDEDA